MQKTQFHMSTVTFFKKISIKGILSTWHIMQTMHIHAVLSNESAHNLFNSPTHIFSLLFVSPPPPPTYTFTQLSLDQPLT